MSEQERNMNKFDTIEGLLEQWMTDAVCRAMKTLVVNSDVVDWERYRLSEARNLHTPCVIVGGELPAHNQERPITFTLQLSLVSDKRYPRGPRRLAMTHFVRREGFRKILRNKSFTTDTTCAKVAWHMYESLATSLEQATQQSLSTQPGAE